MGREVQTLVNESLKPGTYETSFDGSALNSGVYFYKLMIRHGGSSTGFSETKKNVDDKVMIITLSEIPIAKSIGNIN